MKKKLIGVTPRILYENEVRKQFVNERYLKALISRGFNTIMLTLDNPNIEEILDLCDGFLITGGTDIDPLYFNEENKGESKNCDPHLDTLDQQVVLHVKKTKKPLLGICRGHQAISVFFGGSLHQDIGNSHENCTHQVVSVKNRFIDWPYEFEVNSYHHQVTKDLPNEFEIIATSTEDNFIEAILHKELPVFGVQWHPEMRQENQISKMIFDNFAKWFN